MAKDLLVEDVMTRDVVSVDERISVLEAATILIERGISGLPVVDAEGRVSGILTEDDFLGVFLDGERNLKRTPIGTCAVLGTSLITRRVKTCFVDTQVRDVARTMMVQKIKRLPVVDADKKLIGIVSRRDILRGIVERARLA